MGNRWRWLLGASVALMLSALPAQAQVHIGVSVGSPRVVVGPYYDPYYDGYYRPYYRYRPVRGYRGRPHYDRYNHEYRKDVARARREYQREIREARRDYQRDVREARRDRRR